MPSAPLPTRGPVETAVEPGTWSPQEACAFLDQIAELRTRGYNQYFETEYGCSSPYKVFATDGPGMANNLAYYVIGTAHRAAQLKLVLNVNDKPNAKAAHAELRTTAEALAIKALGSSNPSEVLAALIEGSSGTWDVDGMQLEVKREEWPTKGYSLHYLLRRAQ